MPTLPQRERESGERERETHPHTGRMDRQVQVVVMALLLLAVPGTRGEVVLRCKVPLVVFGASMMDVGENAAANPFLSAAEFPPYGVDYFKAPAARYSNGRVISDFISIGLGYGLMDPYLNSVNPRFHNGVNFASSGSTVRNLTESGPGVFSLEVQVRQYELFKMKVRKAQERHGGRLRYLPTSLMLSRAIHVIMQAHNDYIQTISGPAYNPITVVTSVVSAFESILRELYSVGARTMIIMNVLPLGCTPILLTYGEATSKVLDEDSCIAEFNSLVNLHNHHLQQLLSRLREELAWDKLVMFDLNAIYIDAVRHPSKYGVKYPLQACCGVGGKYNLNNKIGCGKKGMLNGKEVEAGRCASPTEYISWDGLHPTESFAKQIALALLSGKYFSPSLSLRDACD